MPKPEPFGYFRAEPFGWTDCAETDEGSMALYDQAAVDSLERERDELALIIATDTGTESAVADLQRQLVAVTAERDNFASHGHRLALELECLLMDTKDLPTVSKWWGSGMSALTNWQNLFPYDGPRIGE